MTDIPLVYKSEKNFGDIFKVRFQKQFVAFACQKFAKETIHIFNIVLTHLANDRSKDKRYKSIVFTSKCNVFLSVNGSRHP